LIEINRIMRYLLVKLLISSSSYISLWSGLQIPPGLNSINLQDLLSVLDDMSVMSDNIICNFLKVNR